MVSFTANTLYMNVSSLLPAFVEKEYDTLNAFNVGCLMSVFPVGFLISAPIIGSNLERAGRKNIEIAGIVLMTVSTLTFGLASYFKNVWVFYTISTVARFM